MNVGQMRKLIEGVPDDVELFTIVGDHEAEPVFFEDYFVTEDKQPGKGTWNGEFFGDDALIDNEVKVRALVSNP